MQLLIFEDNVGDYHWAIVAGDGATLARSGGFASYDDAKQAADQIRHGVASAPLEAGAAGARPADLILNRDASGENSNAERRLEAGGSFSNETVAK